MGPLRHRDFRLLWSARMASQFSDGLLQAALILSVVFSPTKASSPIALAQTLALVYLPYSLIGPFVGTVIDRWSRRSILLATPLVRALFVLPLLFIRADLPWWALASGLIVFSGNRFFLATAAAVVPRLVPTEDLVTANSVSIVGGTFAAFLGTFVGGLLAESVGGPPLVMATAVLWVLTALVASRISTKLTAHHGSQERVREGLITAWNDLRDGARRLARTPRASWPMASIVLDQFVQYYVIVMSLFVFRDVFHEGIDAYSWLLGAAAVGILIGIATVARLGRRYKKERVVAVGFAIGGAGMVANAIVLQPWMTLASAMLLGMTFAWKKVSVDTMVQEATPDAFRGRVFSVYDVFFNMARVAAAYAAVVLLGPVGAAGSLLLWGVVCLVWSPVLPRVIRRTPEFVLRSEGDTPVAVIRGGPEEVVVAIITDERVPHESGTLRTVGLELDDGSRVDAERTEPDGAWILLDER